ncbi:MAG TPA: hypothetical protein PKH07_18325, partial [bacterium]|nr:hypothetical protein [bacterium]
LIVVAIIGILAAIAIPNFLMAQMRAKVARAQADMQASGTAIESYLVDNNVYPLDSPAPGPHTYVDDTRLPNSLTTPIAYLKNVTQMQDPFRTEDPMPAGADENYYRRYEYWDFKSTYLDYSDAFWNTRGNIYINGNGSFVGYGRWTVSSYGPDKTYGPYELGTFGIRVLYDPSNGTVSPGEIIRCQKFAQMKNNHR